MTNTKSRVKGDINRTEINLIIRGEITRKSSHWMRNSSCSRLKTWELRDFNQENPVLQTREREKIKLMNRE